MNINRFFRQVKLSMLHRVLMPFKLVPAGLYNKRKLQFAKKVRMQLFKKGDVISDNIAFAGFYEEKLSKEIVRLAKESKTMVDAGANMGYFSLLFAANASSPTVYSFEPSRSIYQILESNIEGNGFGSLIIPQNRALSSYSGKINFNAGNTSQSGWGSVDANSGESIECTSLDDFFADQQQAILDVLKIDVEGHELKVFEGCRRLLEQRRIKNIFFEINTNRLGIQGTTEDELITWITRLGYDMHRLEDKVMHAVLK